MKKLKYFFFFTLIFISYKINAQTFPEIAGWKIAAVKIYNADNLWDRIDGGAEGYLKFDFIDLQVEEYTLNDSVYLTVEVYKFKNPNCAFGIYSQERQAKAEFIHVGTEGYKSKGLLNFLTGDKYVKIFSHDNSEQTMQAMNRIAKELSEKSNTFNELPSQLKDFPIEGKIERSERYIAKEFLGYSFFLNVFQSEYTVNGQTFTLFISEQDAPTACEQMLSAYFKSCNFSKKIKEGIFTVKDKYNGTVVLQWKGKYIWGVLNCNDSKLSEAYLLKISQQLDQTNK